LSLTGSAAHRKEAGLRFWVEAFLVVGVYVGYSMVRNLFGSVAVTPGLAANNADRIISIEKAMGLFLEADLQKAFIDATIFIQFWNLFYGVFHFLVTFGALVWLYLRFPGDYRFWRRAGLIGTASAVAGFAAFPLMPPRLLGDCGKYGACRPGEPFVDTVIEIGGIWSFESAGLETISNQYAAMPSLHIAWALWCALILVPRLRSVPARLLAASYPLLTLFAIVVTANHYWIDGVGGIAVMGFGYGASRLYERVTTTTGVTPNPMAFDSGADDFGTSVGIGVT
jgi:hypothetical protein